MNLKDCKWSGCWNSRYEMLGLAFLIIATVLTIIAWDSFGIVAMFVVGVVLLGHKHLCCIGSHRHQECCDVSKCSDGSDKKESGHKKKEA